MDRRHTVAVVTSAIGIAIAAAGLVFVVRQIVDQWDEVREEIADASWGWLVVAFVVAAVGMTLIALGWVPVLRALGGKLTFAQAVRWYFPGEIGKYVPGGVWPVVGRAELARRGGVRRRVAYPSVALSLVTLYLAAMATVLLALPFAVADERDSSTPFLVLVLLPLGLLALHPKVVGGFLRLVERLTGRELGMAVPSWRAMIGLVVRFVPAWVAIGTATWAVARAFTDDAPFADVFVSAVLSWIVGFVLVPVPGGIGVREAVFTATVSLPSGTAATVALVARLGFMLVDALGAVAAPVLLRGRGGAPEAAPSSPDPSAAPDPSPAAEVPASPDPSVPPAASDDPTARP